MKRPRATLFSLTQTGTGIGSLHYGLLIQHRALCQWQICSHPCNWDPMEQEVSYHIASTTVTCQKTCRTCTLAWLNIKHQHLGFYSPWNMIGWIPSTSQRVSQGADGCSNRERQRPTCHQICASGSQTRPSASCRSPGRRFKQLLLAHGQ